MPGGTGILQNATAQVMGKGFEGEEFTERGEIFPANFLSFVCEVNPGLLLLEMWQRASPCVRTSPCSPGKELSRGITDPKERKGSSTAGSDRREVSCELQKSQGFLAGAEGASDKGGGSCLL